MLELTKETLGNRQIARDNSERFVEIVKIDLSKIVIRFNIRENYGDLNGLAYSILENGQTSPGLVDVLNDGNFALVDGHRRFKALQMLQEMGNDVGFFKAVVNSTKTTEEQRILQMFTTQDNKPLEPHEVADLIKRLINLGHTQATVAKKIGKTAGYISQMLNYANESPAIKEEVKKGNITVSAALKLQKDIPVQSERVRAVKEAVSNKKEGSKTITVTQVTGKSNKEIKDEKISDLAETIIERFNITNEDGQNSLFVLKSLISQFF